MNDNDKLDEYSTTTLPVKDEELVPGYLYQEENLIELEKNINLDLDYSYFSEDQLSDLKINLFLEYSNQLLKCKFEIGENQKKSFNQILNQLVDIIPPNNFELIFTPDKELQFFRSQIDANASIIIDENGGITLAIIGDKGLGYKYDYLNVEQIDPKSICQFTERFLRDHFC